jgi:hypothetical protein
MATRREEMKKLRLQAIGVVGEQTENSIRMFERVIAKGEEVTLARERAEAAHMGALDEQAADLRDMAEDMAEFAQVVPPKGAGVTSAPATSKAVTISDALAALNAAQPQPKSWPDGNAYRGTTPEE